MQPVNVFIVSNLKRSVPSLLIAKGKALHHNTVLQQFTSIAPSGHCNLIESKCVHSYNAFRANVRYISAVYNNSSQQYGRLDLIVFLQCFSDQLSDCEGAYRRRTGFSAQWVPYGLPYSAHHKYAFFILHRKAPLFQMNSLY